MPDVEFKEIFPSLLRNSVVAASLLLVAIIWSLPILSFLASSSTIKVVVAPLPDCETCSLDGKEPEGENDPIPTLPERAIHIDSNISPSPSVPCV